MVSAAGAGVEGGVAFGCVLLVAGALRASGAALTGVASSGTPSRHRTSAIFSIDINGFIRSARGTLALGLWQLGPWSYGVREALPPTLLPSMTFARYPALAEAPVGQWRL